MNFRQLNAGGMNQYNGQSKKNRQNSGVFVPTADGPNISVVPSELGSMVERPGDKSPGYSRASLRDEEAVARLARSG
jgi:hypothetical protein